jgi:2-alkenal reductase
MRRGPSLLIAIIVVVLGIFLLRPYIERQLYSATTPRAVAARGNLADFERLTIEMFEQLAPSVVQVAGVAAKPDLFGGEREGEGGVQGGTGFIWDGAGHIVTNNHVVQGVAAPLVRFASGEVVKAQTVGQAPNYDLAVIRIAGARALPAPIPVGSSADLKVGQAAFAIGNPFGLDQSLTTGVISALKRRLPTSSGREIGNVIQTDAAINPGNSGGPLLDSAGRLIGVNTAIFSPSGAYAGIGFAIPVDVVNRVVPELIRSGRFPTPGIGIQAAPEALAARAGIEGIVIVRTVPGSPAARSGLRGIDPQSGVPGDVIVSVNGKPVRRLADLTEQLELAGVGKTIELGISRGGNRRTVSLEVVDIGA